MSKMSNCFLLWWLLGLVLMMPSSSSLPQRSTLKRTLPCTLSRIALIGGDLPESDGGGGLAAADAQACSHECARRATCKFWSHVQAWKVNCFLKAEAGEERAMDGATTGWKGDGCGGSADAAATPAPRPESPLTQGLLDNSGCKLEHVVLLGSDLPREMGGDGMALRSYVECRSACRRQSGCKAFTFVPEWDLNCFLKADFGEESPFDGAASGTLVECSEVEKLKVPRQTLVGDPQQQHRLAQQPGSKARRPVAAAPANAPVRASVPEAPVKAQSEVVKNTQDASQEESGEECQFANTNFLGGELEADGQAGLETKDAAACSTECRSRPQCTHYSFISQWKVNCYLKQKLGEKADFEGGTSGTYGHRCNDPQLKGGAAAAAAPSSTAGASPSSAESVPSAPAVTSSASGEDCLFENTNFLGGDLSKADGGHGIETKDHSGCAVECKKRPTCTHWTFVGEWKVNCYLKERLGEKSDFKGGVSGSFGVNCGSKSPSPIKSPPSTGGSSKSTAASGEECRFENTNFLGGDLSMEEGGNGIEAKDPAGCSAECQKRPKCTHWTFVGEWKINCYLKERLGEKADFEGGVSGTYGSNCDANNPSASSSSAGASTKAAVQINGDDCMVENTNFLGGDLSMDDGGGGLEAKDPAGCAVECKKRSKCTHWSFVAEWKVNCYLKEKLGERSDFEGSVAGTFGANCELLKTNEALAAGKPVTVDGDECLFPNTNFLGGELEVDGQGIEAKDLHACSDECKARPQCHYWTFVEKWKVNCYLKSRLGEKVDFEAVSGTYGSRCDLDTPVASEAGGVAPADVASKHEKDGAGCRYPGINLLGGDLAATDGGHGMEAADADACKVECAKRPKCQYWSYIKQWKVSCYLKERKGPETQTDGATSGAIFVACGTKTEDELGQLDSVRENDHECAYSDMTLVGADLPASHGGLGTTTGSAEDCRLECLKRPVCHHWTHIKDWKVDCYLKAGAVALSKKEGATSGSIGERCHAGATSLPSSGSPSASLKLTPSSSSTGFAPPVIVAPTNNRKDHCTYDGMNAQGGDLSEAQGGHGLEAADAEACAAMCQDRTECQFWTFVSKWKVGCYLKASLGELVPNEDAVSGSIGVKCQQSEQADSASSPLASSRSSKPSSPSPSSSSSKKVPAKPSSQPDNVCFFPGTNLLGGDLVPKGVAVTDANACAVECYRRNRCRYYVFVDGFANNCFPKSHFDEEERMHGATAGSLGLSCE